MNSKNRQNLDILRHTLSHVLMQALSRLYGAIPGVGPAIENGFYHDIALPSVASAKEGHSEEEKISLEDLPKIEKEMRKIIKENLPIEKKTMPIDEGIKFLKDKGYLYTAELAEDLKAEFARKSPLRETLAGQHENLPLPEAAARQAEISFFQQGEFINMCKGPHLTSTGEINPDAFHLAKVAGAYWKGDEKNKMLQRVYGVAFETKEELDEYLKMLEEAEKRDHRKLGKELDLFVFSDLVGPGLPLFTPKGVTILEELQKHIEQVCRGYGFEKVKTPHLAKIELFELSGHAKKFSEELFHVTSSKGHKFVMKPVQCPHQTQIYASKIRSYRDLPIRYMESEKQYRAEKTGEVGGLNRVYAITVEDGHSFCRVDQVKEEVKIMVNIIKDFYTALGLWKNHWISLSVRDYAHPEKYIGDAEDWDKCEKMLQEISDEMGLNAKRCEGEAALYGPKLDFMFKDAIGKEIQIPTVQLDFATPKRFNLAYINELGKEEAPVMVHRAVLGSYERFLALLIEHFAGAFPVWLSPAQVKIISVGEAHIEHCKKLADEFKSNNIRVEVDANDETVGNKIRKARAEKIPYVLVIGDKEIGSGTLHINIRGQKELVEMEKNEFIEKVKKEVEERK